MCNVSDQPQLCELAAQLLARDPDPVVRFRLLRDVLQRPGDDPERMQARKALDTSYWVQQLANEQWDDGSWGSLHSQDYGAAQRIPTTEAGVERALALGLDATHPILRRAASHLVRLLKGTEQCRDRPEKNDRWDTGVELFAASTLSRIDPALSVVDGPWALWRDVARRSFSSGSYDPEGEAAAHRAVTGASVRGSYLVIDNKYAFALVGSRATQLSPALEAAIVRWVWHKEDGIGYLREALFRPPRPRKPGHVDRWLTSQELMAHFPSWPSMAGDIVEWLWAQRNEDERWDFGPGLAFSAALPLSETWRTKGARPMDWTTRVLTLLQCCYAARDASSAEPGLLGSVPQAPEGTSGPTSRYVIRRMPLAHCKKGPDRCDICRQMAQERICVLDLHPPGRGLEQRRAIEIGRDGESVWQEFDIVRTFDSEEEALAYAQEHRIDDVEL